MGNFKIVCSRGTVSVWAMNMVTTIGTKCIANGEIAPVLVDGKTLKELIGRMREDVMQLEVEDNKLSISCGSVSARLNTSDPNTFPRLPQVTDWIKLRIEDFDKALRQVVFATGESGAEQMLEGVHIETRDNCLVLSATNKYQLSVRSLPIKEDVKIDSAIVPSKSIDKLSRIMDSNVSISYSGGHIAFKGAMTFLSSQLIDAKYPPIHRFYRNEYKTRFVVEKGELRHAVLTANVLGSHWDNIVQIDIEDAHITVSGRSAEQGRATVEFPAFKQQGENSSFICNGKFMAELLQAVDGDRVAIEMTSPYHPILLKPVETENHWLMVMPMQREGF